MDPRVRAAVTSKIAEAIGAAGEVKEIQRRIPSSSPQDLALGIAVGRIYNSFHYQTRRILGRDATAAEFLEFLELLGSKMPEIRRALQ
ncbi:hypothetical protein [Nitrososphaera sp.]|uniref:hypothetical protein n=1 Tax=Nitrososphaera sp. TaxID=1971748 RepID=UPI00307D2E38